jgi:hypothetical protein
MTHEHEHSHLGAPHSHAHDTGHHPDELGPPLHEPRFAVAKSPGVGGPPIPDDEHPFVIREQDFLAPFIIKDYLDRYRALAEPDPAVIADVEAHLEHTLAWQKNNLSKVKVADR